jgi:hypothetical protein
MALRKRTLVLAVVLSGCVRSPPPPPVPVENDRSISFPPFAGNVVKLGAQGESYELDGEVLRALTIAANDFLPSSIPNPSCRNQQAAHRYRFMRQGNILFVSIQEDPAYCGREYTALDSGAKYAISTDGRILRRVLDGQAQEEDFGLEPSDAGGLRVPAEPGVPPELDGVWNDPSSPTRLEWRDGGLVRVPRESTAAPIPAPDGGHPPSALDGGGPPVP